MTKINSTNKALLLAEAMSPGLSEFERQLLARLLESRSSKPTFPYANFVMVDGLNEKFMIFVSSSTQTIEVNLLEIESVPDKKIEEI